MPDATPSPTARRVAAYRLGFDRPATGYGDPEADDALARDLAGSSRDGLSEGMARYLRGRTSFFDRVVTGAMDRDVTQVLSVGAGYDGRAFRFAKPGVRWWEVDHPDTQSDKLARIERLGIDAGHVTFVGHDLRQPRLASAVMAAGFDPGVPSVVLMEGVAVYLDPPVLESVLAELRQLATGGARLALSLSRPDPSPDHAANRARFVAAVAGLGEEARNAITPADAAGMFSATGWRPVKISDRAGDAGFVVMAPARVPAAYEGTPSDGAPPARVPSGSAVVRAFLPARDFDESKAFYTALGFRKVLDADVAIFEAGRSQFILTRFFQEDYAENSMMQILVDDLDGWWAHIESLDLPGRFGVARPKAPALQEWGLRVAFVVDPAGVLWHFAEEPRGRGAQARPDVGLLHFDAGALFDALNAERERRGLSWAGVARAVWDQSLVLNERRGDHPISASTITGMKKSRVTDCQHALFMLRWLGAIPEQFLTGGPTVAGAPLPEPGPEHRLRWDLELTFVELEAKRRQAGLTWSQLADQLQCTTSMLTGIRRARFTTGMTPAMRIAQWLGRPASHFVYVADW